MMATPYCPGKVIPRRLPILQNRSDKLRMLGKSGGMLTAPYWFGIVNKT